MFGRKKARIEARRGFVRGHVQTVAFRFYCRQEATQLGLAGWVRNIEDGRVEFHAQGPPRELEEFLAWMRVGPERARVEALDVEVCESEALDTFEIR